MLLDGGDGVVGNDGVGVLACVQHRVDGGDDGGATLVDSHRRVVLRADGEPVGLAADERPICGVHVCMVFVLLRSAR